jgi:uracil-DNA glycosylase
LSKEIVYRFPFGRPLENTPPQKARKAKAFVVGVYASAVHARWIGPDGKEACKALAVSSEPCSFWDGTGADAIIADLQKTVPSDMGRLEVPARQFNGPSGGTLLEMYLAPLGLRPAECWITDLHDRYFLSPGNEKAVARYEKLRNEVRSAAPPAALPQRPERVIPTKERLTRLRDELGDSGARLVITLGNEPLRPLLGNSARKLSLEGYGQPEGVEVFGQRVRVLRLCHPRQAGGLGTSSESWAGAHTAWVKRAGGRAVV